MFMNVKTNAVDMDHVVILSVHVQKGSMVINVNIGHIYMEG